MSLYEGDLGYVRRQEENIDGFRALRPHSDRYYPPSDDVRLALEELLTGARRGRENQGPCGHRCAIERLFLQAVVPTKGLAVVGHEREAAMAVAIAVQLRAWGLREVTDARAAYDMLKPGPQW